jgi:hypothetical protein
MATSLASYPKPQPALTLEVRGEQNLRPQTIGQVCRDLEELCAAGFLEAFRDEHNIVRYRPLVGTLPKLDGWK